MEPSLRSASWPSQEVRSLLLTILKPPSLPADREACQPLEATPSIPHDFFHEEPALEDVGHSRAHRHWIAV
jgi:hypothetical protein